MREVTLERRLNEKVKELGGRTVKFDTRSQRDWPDRLCLFPGEVCAFVEVKRPGGLLRPGQVRMLNELNRMGFNAICVNSLEKLDNFIREMAWQISQKAIRRLSRDD